MWGGLGRLAIVAAGAVAAPRAATRRPRRASSTASTSGPRRRTATSPVHLRDPGLRQRRRQHGAAPPWARRQDRRDPGQGRDLRQPRGDRRGGALGSRRRARARSTGFTGAKTVPIDAIYEVECDIFVPAAIEGVLSAETAKKLKCKLVAEGANGPTRPDGEEVLTARKIEVIPDILANSGGVIVSYYEWVQNRLSENWDLEEVDAQAQEEDPPRLRSHPRGVGVARRRRAHGRVRLRDPAHRGRLHRARASSRSHDQDSRSLAHPSHGQEPRALAPLLPARVRRRGAASRGAATSSS